MRIIFYLHLLSVSFFYAQNIAKKDTIFSVKYFSIELENSKIDQLTNNLKSSCVTKEIKRNRNNLSNNSEYSVLRILNGFNRFTKSSVFSDYEYLIYVHYCNKCEVFDDILLIEFQFSNKLKSETFKKKIDLIIKDKVFFNYPQEKLFYYKILSDNVCYLLISVKQNSNNEIFRELKSKIDKL